MAVQDLTTAKEECRVCLEKWRGEAEALGNLIEDASQYSAEAFAQSVNDRMPKLQRHARAFLARLSIFIQVMHEIESESRAGAGE
jgi:hypothetical protein